MCISPHLVNSGQLVGCRLCWQCREQIINDWVGRCLAESKTSKKTIAVTLTYGRDEYGEENHIRSSVLTYSDVQKYFKRLRKDGFQFRYFVVGEYGSIKARAHWHLILFFKTEMPDDIILNERFIQKHWTQGYSQFDPADAGSVRYACKYLFKDQKDEQKNVILHMSKKPPLGSDYFKELARIQIDAGLSPQDLFYSFSEVTNKKGDIIKFLMKGRSAEIFLESYIDLWIKKFPEKFYPYSELVEDYLDSLVPEDLSLQQKIYKRKFESVEEAIKETNRARSYEREIQYKLYIKETKGSRKSSVRKKLLDTN